MLNALFIRLLDQLMGKEFEGADCETDGDVSHQPSNLPSA